jgi:hypothetical protein
MNTKPKSQSSRGVSRRLSGSLTLTALGAVAAVLLNGQLARAQPEIPAGSDLSSWQDNGHDGKYLLKVTNGAGAAPAVGASSSGVVLSDTNCEPDAEGMNHCRNGIRLANGKTIYVINNHRMARYRCLQPEETVSLTTLSNGWVVALTGKIESHE